MAPLFRHGPRRPLPDVPITGAADARWSTISSSHDLYTMPNDGLLDIALSAAQTARGLSLAELECRSIEPDLTWIRSWPGEHYRLLAALVRNLQPRSVVEVGTFKGQGALALAAGSSETSVVTYDIVPWRAVAGTALVDADFGPKLEQRLGDLGQADYRDTQQATLRDADLIFIDGPKDGSWEQLAVPAICRGLTDRRRLVVLDDIRLLPMVQLWRDLPYPKLDVTSLGHWSGTGLMWTTVE